MHEESHMGIVDYAEEESQTAAGNTVEESEHCMRRVQGTGSCFDGHKLEHKVQ